MIKIRNLISTFIVFIALIFASCFYKKLVFLFIPFLGIVLKLIFSKKVNINNDILVIESIYFKYEFSEKEISYKECFVEENHNLLHLHINDKKFITEINERNSLQLLNVIDFLKIASSDRIKEQITKWANLFH